MSLINKLPIVKKIKQKLYKRLEVLENESLISATENINLRIKLKLMNHEKINVVFVCHRPQVWLSLKNVYEAMCNDDFFDVKIVTIPNKKQLKGLGLNHEEYASEGAEDFWKGGNVIQGYDYNTKTWLDLRKLKPDYICFQQPYNVTRCPLYKSYYVSRFAKIFYVAYASNFMGNGLLEETTPKDFANSLSFFFTQNEMDNALVKSLLSSYGNIFTDVVLTGFPRYDFVLENKNAVSNVWSYKERENKFRLIWTPRWTTNEGNCNFFDYKDLLLDYCLSHDEIDFVFRPHPQAFSEWIANGLLTKEEAALYQKKYADAPNANIDKESLYLNTFYSSDCLITDVSSIVAEYFLTGKPIIYCHKKDYFNDFSRKLSEGFYWVHSWTELLKTLEMLKAGNDPLKVKREELIKSQFYIPENGAGFTIKEYIKNDAKGLV